MHKASIFIQATICLFFIYLFIRLNVSVKTIESKVVKETQRNEKLNQILAELEHQVVAADTTSKNISRVDSDFSKSKTVMIERVPGPKKKVLISQGKEIKIDSNKNQVKDITIKKDSSNDLPNSPRVTYESVFHYPIHISNHTDITQISCLIFIKYNLQKQPRDIRAELEMKESGENEGVSRVSFQCIKVQVNLDNSVSCVFKEYPQPEKDEFGFPSYQRNLAMSLSGSLNNNTLDGLIIWDEVSGRPMNARIKIPVTIR